MNGVLRACDGVCGWNRDYKGDALWRNKEIKIMISRNKDVHKAMCQNSTEENRSKGKRTKNKAKKAVSEEMREKATEALSQ